MRTTKKRVLLIHSDRGGMEARSEAIQTLYSAPNDPEFAHFVFWSDHRKNQIERVDELTDQGDYERAEQPLRRYGDLREAFYGRDRFEEFRQRFYEVLSQKSQQDWHETESAFKEWLQEDLRPALLTVIDDFLPDYLVVHVGIFFHFHVDESAVYEMLLDINDEYPNLTIGMDEEDYIEYPGEVDRNDPRSVNRKERWARANFRYINLVAGPF